MTGKTKRSETMKTVKMKAGVAYSKYGIDCCCNPNRVVSIPQVQIDAAKKNGKA